MIEKITLQSIFNKAWQHFAIEYNPPASIKGGCYYKKEVNGIIFKCGVGLSLPEGHPSQECTAFFADLVTKWPSLFDNTIIDGNNDGSLELTQFQKAIHDNLTCTQYNENGGSQLPDKWQGDKEWLQAQYREIAKKYNLTIPGELVQCQP